MNSSGTPNFLFEVFFNLFTSGADLVLDIGNAAAEPAEDLNIAGIGSESFEEVGMMLLGKLDHDEVEYFVMNCRVSEVDEFTAMGEGNFETVELEMKLVEIDEVVVEDVH